jgi:predicted acetyltransferase
MLAGTGTDHLELTVPGPALVPSARTMLTAVSPTERRRGLMRSLMEWQIRDAAEHGEAVLVGTTPVPGIVARFDYWATAQALSVEVQTGRHLRTDLAEPSGRLRLCDPDDLAATLPGIFDQHRAAQPGQISRRPAFWRMWLRDRPLYRTVPGGRFAVVYTEADGTPAGYLTYRLTSGPLRERPVAELVIEDLVTVTDAARQALWGYCLAFEQAELVTASNLPADEPIGWLLADRGKVRVRGIRDFMVLRLIDVPAALAGRRYGADGSLAIEVCDPTLAANNRTWLLDAGPDGASVEPTTRAPDLTLRVATLGAAYLGGFSFTALSRGGLVQARDERVLARANAMFASYPLPWTVTDW